ncbi:hypothetical protein P4O66_021780 [Electrophorus voltai]|uniref:Uncharacterized protein n=1 Tax=Electrophorus voltai TaxID=2609070 RepID=A0AAD8ZN83_9TELE|nr:hypothetical protein P4O66_021780 [Electrophorus voltai]
MSCEAFGIQDSGWQRCRNTERLYQTAGSVSFVHAILYPVRAGTSIWGRDTIPTTNTTLLPALLLDLTLHEQMFEERWEMVGLFGGYLSIPSACAAQLIHINEDCYLLHACEISSWPLLVFAEVRRFDVCTDSSHYSPQITTNTKASITTNTKASITTNTNGSITTNTKASITTNTNGSITTNTNGSITTNTKASITTNTTASITTNTKITITTNTNGSITTNPKASITTSTNGSITTNPKASITTNTTASITTNTKASITTNTNITVTTSVIMLNLSNGTGSNQYVDTPMVEEICLNDEFICGGHVGLPDSKAYSILPHTDSGMVTICPSPAHYANTIRPSPAHYVFCP